LSPKPIRNGLNIIVFSRDISTGAHLTAPGRKTDLSPLPERSEKIKPTLRGLTFSITSAQIKPLEKGLLET
jgi:hypothetical protein